MPTGKGMSKREYERLYRRTKNIIQKNLNKTKKEIRSGYITAGDRISDRLRNDVFLSKTARDVLEVISSQITMAADEVSQLLSTAIPNVTSRTYQVYAGIEVEYLYSNISAAGVQINKTAIAESYFQIDRRLLAAQANRSVGGLVLSERIWGTVNQGFQSDMRNIVQAGFSQGRDLIEIAKDIEVYTGTDAGKRQLMKRYGKLQEGTPDFIRRIPQNVDWRAIRIARSELYASLQQAAGTNAQTNPGSSGQVKWNLTEGAQHSCICPDLAAESPYDNDNIPDYPHPNCMCYITPLMKSREDFFEEVNSFFKGEESPAMENWYNNTYLPALHS